MKRYILEYSNHDEVLSLLGREIPHKHLENVKSIILDLYEEEYLAIKAAGYTIFENIIPSADGILAFPENLPAFRSYPTAPNYVNTYLKIQQAHLAGFDGTGVKVAILDTGCSDSIAALANPSLIRLDFTNTSVEDPIYNHGNRGCMVVSQRYSFFSPGLEVKEGTAYGCQLYSMNVFVGGTTSVIEAIDYCIANNIDIINISLNMTSGLDTAINAALAAGIIVVCASGNTLGAPIAHPANIHGVIAINGVAFGSATTPFGSYIFADGHPQVTVTFHAEGHYEYRVGGTSQTAWHVSALLAIYKQKYPSLNTEKAIHLLKRKAIPMDGKTYDLPSHTSTRGVLENYQTGAGFVASLY